MLVVGSLVLVRVQLVRVIQNGPIHYIFGGYKIPYGIEFSVDTINAVIVIMVCMLGVLSCMFAFNFDKNGDALQVGGAYTMHALLVLGMVGMTMTGDVFNLYVFLEITSLTAYCLIAMGGSEVLCPHSGTYWWEPLRRPSTCWGWEFCIP